MFVALEVASTGFTGIIGDFINIITRQKTRLVYRECLGARYGVITPIPDGPVKPAAWRRIAGLSGRYGDRLLLPRGLDAPSPLREPAFPDFERAVLLKTAIAIIDLTNLPMYRRVAGLVDESGDHVDLLFPLLHHYTSIKVLTAKEERYSAEAARIIEELGAPVTIIAEASAFDGCALVIAPSGFGGYRFAPGSPVLCPRADVTGSLCISGLQCDPPYGLECPNGIDSEKFMAALYEFCGVEELAQPASRVILGNAYANLAEASLAVRRAAGYNGVKY